MLDRTIVLPVHVAPGTPYLKHVHEIGVERHCESQIQLFIVEVYERKTVEQDFVIKQLLPADVDGVLRDLERVAQLHLLGGELDLRNESSFRIRRKHDGGLAVDSQFEMAQDPRVVVAEADVGGACGNDVPGHGCREKSLPVNQRKIVDLTRDLALERESGLDVSRGDRVQFI